MAEARGEQQRHPEKTTHHNKYVSNDSSVAGDEFYDAMDYVGKARRMSSTGGASSAFGSNTSRARSSSAGTLLPSPAAAELMAVLASVGSSKNLDVSAFSTAGEFETPGSLAIDEGEPGGTLGLDGFYGYRSKNPFNNDDDNSVAEEGGTNATDVRRWPPSQHQQPSKVVVMDISSAENTPVHTPVGGGSRRLSGEGGAAGGGGWAGGGGGGPGQAPLWGARSPSSSPCRRPPPLPPRRESNPFAEEAAAAAAAAATTTTPTNAAAKTATTAAASTNPFATPTPSLNPFVTASSSLNPFADTDSDPAAKGEEEQEWATASPAAGATLVADGGGGGGRSAAAPAATEGKLKPPPLPPRRAASPTAGVRATSTTSATATTSTLMTATTMTNPPTSGRGGRAGEGATSGPASPRSTLSSATCDSVRAADLEGSEGMDAGGSVGSSTASDATGGTAEMKYMVVNKDTGQKFDLRELEQHLPADDYAFLPSRNDLIEMERRRSTHGSGGGSGGSGVDGMFPPPRSGSASPRSSLPAPGKPSTRKEKAKQLGSMMRKKFGKAANAAGAAATAASAASAAIASSSPRTSTGDSTATATSAAVAEGDGDASKPVTPGAAGDRGSGGMGAAARVVSDALAGIRVSLKGKESSETLAGLMLFQELRCHDGPIWAAAFNHSGKFLATAGQDTRILLHRVGDVREDIGDGACGGGAGGADETAGGSVPPPASSASSGTPTAAAAAAAGNRRSKEGEAGRAFPPEGSPAAHTADRGGGGGGDGGGEVGGDASVSGSRGLGEAAGGTGGAGGGGAGGSTASNDETGGGRPGSDKRAAATVLIDTTPWQILEAHRGDVVALSWSRNDFLLSASLDKTVRLWHTTQGHCLHFFQHAETVTSVDFHPCFEHFFLSGCFDKKVRVWNIRDGRVHEWQQAPDMVTAAKFSLDGQMIVAGLYMGQVLFYQTEGMRYFTQIECRNRRGTKKRGCKVSGFAFKKTDVVKKDDKGSGSGKDGEGGKDGTSKEGKISDANSSNTKDSSSSGGGGNVKGGSRSGKDRGSGGSGGGGGGGGSGGGDGVGASGIDIRPPAAFSPGTGRPPREGAPPSLGGSGSSIGGSGTGGGVGGLGGGGGGGAGSHIPEQLLVTTNDSRLRLYNTDDFGMNAKYKGFANDTLQITASFSEDGKQIICGSENGKVYVWSTGVFAATSPSTLPGSPALPPLSTALPGGPAPAAAPSQKDTNRCHESFQATFDPPRIVTTACFVPESTSRACVTAVRGGLSKGVMESEGGGYCGCMILATDYSGHLRVYCKSAIFLS